MTALQQVQDALEQIRTASMPLGELSASTNTCITQEGEMRMAPNRPWLPFVAEEILTGPNVDFSWKARIKMFPLLNIKVLDTFENGRGRLAVSVFGLVPIARSAGPATDRGEALRGLSELPWRPAGFRQMPHLSWDLSTGGLLQGTFDDGVTHVTAEFRVDAGGHILSGSACRPRLVGKETIDTEWSGTFAEYQMFDSVCVPTYAEATWHLPEGPFTYWRGRVVDFQLLH